MAASSLYARPSDDLITLATVSATNENANYPATNLKDYDPANPFKATNTSTTISVTHTSAARHAVAFINHNLVGATVTVGGVSVTIPARTSDGQCVNAWGLLGPLSASTSTSIAISGASANVQIGRIVLVSTLRDLNWIYGVELSADHPITRIRTFGGSQLKYDRGYRVRRASGTVTKESNRSAIEALWQSAKGGTIPWLLIPDQAVNDAWYVAFTEDAQSYSRVAPNTTAMPISVEELSMGLPL